MRENWLNEYSGNETNGEETIEVSTKKKPSTRSFATAGRLFLASTRTYVIET